jgi:hypothetical protein
MPAFPGSTSTSSSWVRDLFPRLGTFLLWLIFPWLVAQTAHILFGRRYKLLPARQLARKTRAMMKPVSPNERPAMDNTDSPKSSVNTAEILVKAGVTAGIMVVAYFGTRKLAETVAVKITDAVVDTLTKPKVPVITDAKPGKKTK